ncbi:hypothetical protein BDY17DRAFT_296164 [Neohortaea acidophila]|uniref:Carbohydrate-binding module family 19 domain-containing protein n=1 Tax=Neohortaea acidophila TaxID=245834 RepID=A0A6A6PY83_9PEZI|nr:uncharacterized protein BDY17DRAFT_296164 [Neohortaea acidophila]KAF2484704.1 hypothetical protein BDY17DRAFT_296164 [Neohortaea acidophila]
MKVPSLTDLLPLALLLTPPTAARPTRTYPWQPTSTVSTTCSPNGAVICNGPHQYGLCNFGSVIFQPVALGTICYKGAVVAAGSEPGSGSGGWGGWGPSTCSPNGKLICKGQYQYGLCNFGSVVFQSVALGTKCIDGQIVDA